MSKWIYRVLGLAAGGLFADQLNHLKPALAFGLQAQSMPERVGAVLLGVVLLGLFIAVIRRRFNRSFANGFVVATGLFLSFDIVVFHWVFQLHRITSGVEANVLEPIFVVCGVLLIWSGLKSERSSS